MNSVNVVNNGHFNVLRYVHIYIQQVSTKQFCSLTVFFKLLNSLQSLSDTFLLALQIW